MNQDLFQFPSFQKHQLRTTAAENLHRVEYNVFVTDKDAEFYPKKTDNWKKVFKIGKSKSVSTISNIYLFNTLTT